MFWCFYYRMAAEVQPRLTCTGLLKAETSRTNATLARTSRTAVG